MNSLCVWLSFLGFFSTFAYATASGRQSGVELSNAELEQLERLISAQKRGGARAFGPRAPSYDLDTYLFPNTKRFGTIGSLSPYYFYRPPKRGGGRAFSSFWNPPRPVDDRFYEESPYFKKRSLGRDALDEYSS